MSDTILDMFIAETAVMSASFPISAETIANPPPNSPAFSASMAALSESRLVRWLTVLTVVTAAETPSAFSCIIASLDATDSVAESNPEAFSVKRDRYSPPSRIPPTLAPMSAAALPALDFRSSTEDDMDSAAFETSLSAPAFSTAIDSISAAPPEIFTAPAARLTPPLWTLRTSFER